ncbi:pyridoxal-phosphate dependent enzyme [Halalkalicoccus sp. NIPERK01]|uniref:pyridoxal-phosphate dependent enzyme n=1 Tax=Halalkalicoccus sp. NIPERK01 TaxID=3053469 RepID=UPI00256EBDE2|nr:pyridoxal-phosphate dependent enzyme [Halalkalicoccus sp. NIPERK01]MDL5362746.1 pyridoxal-phosphate dependent enzyme [Halalkalicoccus sp. NIPERK01]
MVSNLVCPVCERTYPASVDEPWRCSCGHPLELADRPLPDGPPPAIGDLDTRRGLWAFSAFLPIAREVSLGEGWTPLVPAPEWDAAFKLEYVFPTGSFKDRGATMVLSRTAELGVERVIEDSSGNAGAAIATYAARAVIDAEIYVPASVKASKVAAIERAGGTVVKIGGGRGAVTEACIEAVEAGDGWYASHAWNPAFFAGTQTVAFEIAAQRDWGVPDAVVLPLGHGTLFLGAYRGFRALREAGWTDSVPRLLGAQAAGYAPIAGALGDETAGENDVADGVQIREPVRREEIREAIAQTGGDAIAIGERETERELDRLHRAGFYVEPTSALGPAALREYRERGVLDGDDVVVPLTGSGLKAEWG